jgi:hypothetical protein
MVCIMESKNKKHYKLLREKLEWLERVAVFFCVFFFLCRKITVISRQPKAERTPDGLSGLKRVFFRLMMSPMIAFIVSARTRPVSPPNENRGSSECLTVCQVSPKISFGDSCVLMRSSVVPNNVLWFGTRIRSVHRLFQGMFHCSTFFHEGTRGLRF